MNDYRDMTRHRMERTGYNGGGQVRNVDKVIQSLLSGNVQPDPFFNNESDLQSVFDRPLDLTHTFNPVGLEGFKFNHLGDRKLQARLKHGIEKTRKYIAAWPSTPCLSAVIFSDRKGVGKTTLAHNILQSFKTVTCSLMLPDHLHFADSPEEESETVNIAEEAAKLIPDPETVREIVEGRMYHAADLMAMLLGVDRGDGQGSTAAPLMSNLFRGQKLIVIDDLGEEKIPFHPKEEDMVKARPLLYAQFFDYIYKAWTQRKIRHHVVVTTSTPMYRAGKDGAMEINPAFHKILGSSAFSRLYHMSQGYQIDLSGLADYRPIAASSS